MNFARAYFSFLTIGDAFMAIGGVTGEGYTAEVEEFFNFTQTWSRKNLDLTARSSFVALLLPSPPSTTTTTTKSTTITTTTVVRLPPSGSAGSSPTLSN